MLETKFGIFTDNEKTGQTAEEVFAEFIKNKPIYNLEQVNNLYPDYTEEERKSILEQLNVTQ